MFNVQILSPVRSLRLVSIRSLGRMAVACTLVVVGSSACTHNKLHATFGVRHQAVMAAQMGAHPAHEPVARGEEARAALQNYYSTIQGQNGSVGGGGSSGGAGAMNTAGVAPLH